MWYLYKYGPQQLAFSLPTYLEERKTKTQGLCAAISGETRAGRVIELQGVSTGRHSQSGQQPLKAIRQMPQFSSLATQSQVATPFQHLIFTFMAVKPAGEGRDRLLPLAAELQYLGTKQGMLLEARGPLRNLFSRREGKGCLGQGPRSLQRLASYSGYLPRKPKARWLSLITARTCHTALLGGRD